MENLSAKAATSKGSSHNAALIFFHGLGDNGCSWHDILEHVVEKHVKVVCPHAPTQPVTLNFGMQMPSWFDIKSLTFNGEEDEEGVKKAADGMKSVIDEEVRKGIPYNRIVIGGFSQGGAVALHTFLNTEHKLAGCAGLSTWLPLHQNVIKDKSYSETNKSSKMFLAHGKADNIVNYKYGAMTKELFGKLNFTVNWHEYEGLGHSSYPNELEDLGEYLKVVLP